VWIWTSTGVPDAAYPENPVDVGVVSIASIALMINPFNGLLLLPDGQLLDHAGGPMGCEPNEYALEIAVRCSEGILGGSELRQWGRRRHLAAACGSNGMGPPQFVTGLVGNY
jgi:hypothetical protein